MKPSDTKVIVGLSGGVDSSVAALLLKQQGYQVEGLFMKNWEGDDTEDYCPAAEDLKDVMAVAEILDIPVHIENFSGEYWDRVFEHFLEEYGKGRTPNPDILCNKEVKFKAFLQHALELGADYIATGHYARIQRDPQTGECQLLKGLDDNKDQSYFLYTLQQHQLQKSMFPVGELEKPLVRKMAEDAGLITHDKKDSTGICFIGERKFKDFLQRFLPAQPGDIVDDEGNVIGRHDGLMYHTLGQRKGLGIGGGHGKGNDPWYAADKDLTNNQLIAVQGKQHPLLQHRFLIANTLDWVSGHCPALNQPLKAKIRYRQEEQPCRIIEHGNDTIVVEFDETQTAIAPGQSVVFYDDQVCLGGGVIQSRLHTYPEQSET
ncbi:tRNA 2-thiouridine(34) synthase MnmA [Thiomicrorhabdus heinhorstiae]|uniref:tRNA-specific 2-thiouridylase MnmA n=1 Tax=Thiomicrorhabdus heinhorstiae TaxID=2748010 RepID=A0ABS0BVJ8_9GAMM|nr:tRNA 2-thiouridine(34) synthase MnmA [Thiomicrorhabdus heinhorstiae]MBF6056984.1 tRNA 2-thiouridine(34) synthase MnmA [Thiomicrorhabdus heinhorstiae]